MRGTDEQNWGAKTGIETDGWRPHVTCASRGRSVYVRTCAARSSNIQVRFTSVLVSRKNLVQSASAASIQFNAFVPGGRVHAEAAFATAVTGFHSSVSAGRQHKSSGSRSSGPVFRQKAPRHTQRGNQSQFSGRQRRRFSILCSE